MTCSTPDCALDVLARGLCSAHYWRVRRRERGIALRVSLPPGALATIERLAAAHDTSPAALAATWLAERASAEALGDATAQPATRHAHKPTR